jgi:hypothetical protein
MPVKVIQSPVVWTDVSSTALIVIQLFILKRYINSQMTITDIAQTKTSKYNQNKSKKHIKGNIIIIYK